ncbi:TlpA family protein disulfide reductase [Niabella drilacis]|uniref:Thiol-disulfide isomerase or thioredoxin n=1 Tax=Niabella drilacis (strain DSM 25811 / CCM 8410 / CCUG 62505 / LMG 26954 / E90) TaxID=1285928 RepID=A0A1G6NBT0_NIADE|nr:TlpA disulfide reductase family protein [Niabella drilacis]SDC64864.1 Thiol-disulfide isomerase or thioredoxin [Niabella drilacis]
MKKFIFSCTVLLLGYKGPAQEIRIPFTLQDGYGPFYRTISTISADKSPGNKPPLKGVPSNLDSVQLKVITIIPHQYQYQNLFTAGTKEAQPGTQSYNWAEKAAKERLTEKGINCFLNIAAGINKKTGRTEVVIDQNHNDDFSDDTTFTPAGPGSLKDTRMMERATIPITFERYNGKNTITEKARVLVSMNAAGTIMFNFSQFGSAVWNGYHFYISPRYFMSLSYVNSDLVFGANRSATDKTPLDQILQQGQFLVIKSQPYQFLGVDILTQHIRLKKIPENDPIYSDQIGYQAPSFRGNKVVNNHLMNIADMRGKYLFIDFWATWCKPCLAQLPAIQACYQLADTSKIQFIGVGVDSPEKDLEATINRFQLSYPNIVPDSGIEKKYNIQALPANVLIGKNNIIIAKDISIDSLSAFFKENDLLK